MSDSTFEQKYIDAYKEYYEFEGNEDEEYIDEYFGYFVDDFKAMEDCKTNGELADWFNDYIYHKGLTKDSLYDIVNGKSEKFESVSEWINKVEQFKGIALWVEQVAKGEIDRDEPVSKDNRDELEEKFAYGEYEKGGSFLAICRTAQITGEGEKTMNNEKTTMLYDVECTVDDLVEMAFTNGNTVKKLLMENIDYNPEYIKQAVMENSSLTSDVVENLTADDWDKALEIVNGDSVTEKHGVIQYDVDTHDDRVQFRVEIAFDEEEIKTIAHARELAKTMDKAECEFDLTIRASADDLVTFGTMNEAFGYDRMIEYCYDDICEGLANSDDFIEQMEAMGLDVDIYANLDEDELLSCISCVYGDDPYRLYEFDNGADKEYSFDVHATIDIAKVVAIVKEHDLDKSGNKEQISEATANQKTTFTKEDVTGSKLNSQDRLKSMLGKD